MRGAIGVRVVAWVPFRGVAFLTRAGNVAIFVHKVRETRLPPPPSWCCGAKKQRNSDEKQRQSGIEWNRD